MRVERGRHRWELDTRTGLASLRPIDDEATVFTGTVYPALHLQGADGVRRVLHATGEDAGGGVIRLDYPGGATGSLTLVETDRGVEVTELELDWGEDALVDLFFGLSELTPEQRSRRSDPDYPEWPDWRAGGYCVPSARPAPPASIVRRWDLGQAVVPLGLFGPALGAPYGAAFPRPVYAVGAGDDRGWFVAGAGDVPDAALTFDIRGTSGALRWRYRDDLWGNESGPRRWASPLRMTWADSPVQAFDAYFSTFLRDGQRRRADADEAATRPTWNTWGDYRLGDFDTIAIADEAVDLEARVLVLDDGWESSESSGKPHPEHFPDLPGLVADIRDRGLDVGFWQSVGWVVDLEEAGLSSDDLMPSVDGGTCTANWGMDPRDAAHHALDPSSPRTREFLAQRMRRLVRDYRPAVVKLDFGYGLPGPDLGAPRDPRFRGERLGHELYRILAEAAREENPSVQIQLYGVHPMHAGLADVVALDDMGDHGDLAEAEGHRHWSTWAALLGRHGVAVNGSSGYRWDQDHEVVLNTAVLGSAGAVLPLHDPAQPPTRAQRARRRAINRWQRRTVRWEPEWLDSHLGSLVEQPGVVSWARRESDSLTALCLRAGSAIDPAAIGGIVAEGDWALIVQGDGDLRSGRGRVAVLPAGPGRLRLPADAATAERWVDGTGASEVAPSMDGTVVLEADDEALEAGLEGWVIDLGAVK